MTAKPYEIIKLRRKIITETEWLSTTQGDDIQCISIENLEAILSKAFETKIKL